MAVVDSRTNTRTIAVRNPRTGRTDFDLPVATPQDVAVSAARLRANQPAWEALGLPGRSAVMGRMAGRSAQACRGDCRGRCRGYGRMPHLVPAGLHHHGQHRWLAGGCRRCARQGQFPRAIPRSASVEVRTQFVPYPLCGVISPWNAPMMLALLDAVPALFAGCAVLLKPSEVTPRFTRARCSTSVRAVPELAAVFDFVTGDAETGKAVIDQVDVLCFTGSVPTGRQIAVHCAQRLIPCYLELGGKDPGDRDGPPPTSNAQPLRLLRGAVHANGMVCFAVERIYVAEKHPRRIRGAAD